MRIRSCSQRLSAPTFGVTFPALKRTVVADCHRVLGQRVPFTLRAFG